MPDESTVRKLTRRIGSETVSEMTRALIVKATREKRFRPRAVRIDSTVIEADVRYPTDAGLASAGVRVLAREGRKLAKLIGETKRGVRDRSRSMGRKLRAISRTIRRRSGEAKAEVLALTEQTGELLARSIRGGAPACRARQPAGERPSASRSRPARALCRFMPTDADQHPHGACANMCSMTRGRQMRTPVSDAPLPCAYVCLARTSSAIPTCRCGRTRRPPRASDRGDGAVVRRSVRRTASSNKAANSPISDLTGLRTSCVNCGGGLALARRSRRRGSRARSGRANGPLPARIAPSATTA